MEAIIAAAIGAGVELIRLIFLGVKSKDLTQDEIKDELVRITKLEKEMPKTWWDSLK